jgi:hypothetical protein
MTLLDEMTDAIYWHIKHLNQPLLKRLDLVRIACAKKIAEHGLKSEDKHTYSLNGHTMPTLSLMRIYKIEYNDAQILEILDKIIWVAYVPKTKEWRQ